MIERKRGEVSVRPACRSKKLSDKGRATAGVEFGHGTNVGTMYGGS